MASKEQQLEDFAEKFNLRSKSDLLMLKKCSELQENKHYSVHAMKKMDTTLGQAVLAILGDSPYKDGDKPKFQVYLPRRLVSFLMNEDLDTIHPGMFYLVSHGISNNNSPELTLHVCKY